MILKIPSQLYKEDKSKWIRVCQSAISNGLATGSNPKDLLFLSDF